MLHSREGVKKRYPLVMVDYGIGIVPMRKQLKLTYTDITQPCYADDAGSLCTFCKLKRYFN